jgi:hypothetical protein
MVPKCYGPYTVLKRVGQVAYQLALPSHSKLHLVFHVTPSKRQVNIALSNQSALSGVIMLSFQYYCGVILVILLFICHF